MLIKQILHALLIAAMLISCQEQSTKKENTPFISQEIKQNTIKTLLEKHGEQHLFRIEKGVNQAAGLWFEQDGNNQIFVDFCVENFIADSQEIEIVFNKLSRNFETLFGHFNQMQVSLLEPLHLDKEEPHAIDYIFGAYSAGANLTEDLFANKIAFIVALNFPYYSLSEKNDSGKTWSRKEWAYARMGDMFTSRVPSVLKRSFVEVETNTEAYIADYNIFVGQLTNAQGEKLFPTDMKLLSHWNLRDEIKSNYADTIRGLEKQQMIYNVMQRIVDQTIPQDVINDNTYSWNPQSNEVFKDKQKVQLVSEPNTRYQHILNFFAEFRKQDPYYPQSDTYIKRAFNEGMEISQEDVEKLFVEFVSSPLAKQIGILISQRLGRPLEPFDIWYDGFKARSSINQTALNKITRQKYPNTTAFQQDMPNILTALNFSKEKAGYLSDKIEIDPARGSGHAWGAERRGDVAHLRTRIGKDGMDYKGYNIAIHEFGHNVEQTITLYEMDYYMLHGVPNTAFTEALAFAFQKRDLNILKINVQDSDMQYFSTLDQFWSVYEIMGVSLVDMNVWKWLYNNPDANAEQLKQAVMTIAQEIWNNYYAPVFGKTDQTILAIYSHMIASPLYLPAYPYGYLIEFQLENQLKNKNFADEVQRIFTLGRLTPDVWMQQATGSNINLEAVFSATQAAFEKLR